jgi:hypothetical protein
MKYHGKMKELMNLTEISTGSIGVRHGVDNFLIRVGGA